MTIPAMQSNRRKRSKIWSVLLGVIGIPVLILVTYMIAAAWSIHHAEAQANEACGLFVKDAPAESYIAALKQHGFNQISSPGKEAGETFVDTTFKSIAISRYVCLVDVRNGHLSSAEVRFVD